MLNVTPNDLGFLVLLVLVTGCSIDGIGGILQITLLANKTRRCGMVIIGRSGNTCGGSIDCSRRATSLLGRRDLAVYRRRIKADSVKRDVMDLVELITVSVIDQCRVDKGHSIVILGKGRQAAEDDAFGYRCRRRARDLVGNNCGGSILSVVIVVLVVDACQVEEGRAIGSISDRPFG